jgi:capsular polysaccharide biosynthesis protein
MIEIDIGKLLKALLKRIWIIILVTLLFLAGGYEYTTRYVHPVYTAWTTLYIQNTSNYEGNISSGDLTSSSSLASTVSILLKSTNIMGKVAESLDDGYTSQELAQMFETSVTTNTGVLSISVQNRNPDEAQRIANAIADIAPAELMKFISGGSVKLLDRATLPYYPTSPNIIKNTVLAAAVGFVLSCAALILIELFDTRIKSENDLKQIADIYIIGIIPNVPQKKVTEEKSGGKKRK